MKIGYPGRMFEIPYPSSGMGFSNNSDAETLELDSGGRFVADKATTFKTFNMSWRSTTPKLQPLIDIYNKRYGSAPFYIQDMNGGEGNILPARWAYPEQLVAIHGACGDAVYTGGGFASFRTSLYAGQAPSIKVPVLMGKPLYLAVFNNSTRGDMPIRYRLWDEYGRADDWKLCRYTKVGEAPVTVVDRTLSQLVEFIEIQVNLDGNGHQIYFMDLSTSDYRSFDYPYRSAEGVGGLRFTNVLDGELTMLKAQRVGLSVDLMEVQ